MWAGAARLPGCPIVTGPVRRNDHAFTTGRTRFGSRRHPADRLHRDARGGWRGADVDGGLVARFGGVTHRAGQLADWWCRGLAHLPSFERSRRSCAGIHQPAHAECRLADDARRPGLWPTNRARHARGVATEANTVYGLDLADGGLLYPNLAAAPTPRPATSTTATPHAAPWSQQPGPTAPHPAQRPWQHEGPAAECSQPGAAQSAWHRTPRTQATIMVAHDRRSSTPARSSRLDPHNPAGHDHPRMDTDIPVESPS
jgi:hypothetical protein